MSQIKQILYLSEPLAEQAEALRQAIIFAQGKGAKLTVLEVIPEIRAQFNPMPQNLDINQLEQTLRSERQQYLTGLIDSLEMDAVVSVQIKTGKRFVETIRTVLSDHYDLLIKLAENPPWLERLFGSDDMHLLRKCPCPLWMIKPGARIGHRNILLALDFDTAEPGSALSPLNESLLQFSVEMASETDNSLHILHCWQPPDEMLLKAWGQLNDQQTRQYVNDEKAAHQRSLQRIADYVNPNLGKSGQGQRYAYFHLIEGAADKVIPEQANALDVDLLIMGSVARTGISGVFIGNTAEMVLEQVACSVLVIKPAEFVSPVTLDT